MSWNYDEIVDQVKQVITYSQEIENPKIENVLKIWKEAKAQFIQNMGGELIYRYPEKIIFHMDEEEKKRRVKSFLNHIQYDLGCSDLVNFLSIQDINSLFENRVSETYRTDNGAIVKEGSKLGKAFKHFIANSRVLADLQIELSRIIQEDKIEGYMCLSVHPLDYLSMSENSYKWRSCHALDGEFRAGNLSYMMDSSTIVCYICGEDQVKLPHFPESIPWNSKKWRALFYVSDDRNIIFCGRQYPFSTMTAMDFVLKNILPQNHILSELDNECQWSNWTKSCIEEITLTDINNNVIGRFEADDRFVPIGSTFQSLSTVVIDAEDSAHFNDVLYSTCSTPLYAFKLYKCDWNDRNDIIPYTNNNTKCCVGHPVNCIVCGNYYVNGDTMLCSHCEDEHNIDGEWCPYCDGYYSTQHMEWIGELNSYVCNDCCAHLIRCEHCNELMLDEEKKVANLPDGRALYVCADCQEHFNDTLTTKLEYIDEKISDLDENWIFTEEE